MTGSPLLDAVAGEPRRKRALHRTRAIRAEWVYAHCPLERVELTEVPGPVPSSVGRLKVPTSHEAAPGLTPGTPLDRSA